ncbi:MULTISPECIES: hypothetical protein [unclassified Arsukibacterium]|uniref:hypothetical protein n=2 Tax=Arsukibacterium TaxID=336830 RepID=UPI0025B97DF4|nr:MULTISPECIES: hypothetical protein [unclassified Arsukibacterium]|tara:strand:- start:52 stop:432 length:381 start_codon:yes stop_codon:yes gene_type:complete
MRCILVFVFAIFLAGCASSIAMLQTDTPGGIEYHFIFGRMLIDYEKVEGLNQEYRMVNFEEQLSAILQRDQNTASCFVIPGTINFGEPGSQAAARVRSVKLVNFQVQEGIYARDGAPVYSYVLSRD